ncbi:MAG: NifB/NifX family molybdenum-iron cluster-binding protein [Dehalococcoidia bacterium]|nr:NifB/NifX family molybdenum-iron cluster-binding protein [Dehalococcoidia bacterium]
MKIAISAAGPDLDAEVDPRFGRCMYFIIANPDTGEFVTVNNDSAMASGGAGISAAQMIAARGVKAVLTGNCGPNAYQTLSAAGVEVITGVSGRISDMINNYETGQYKAAMQHNLPDHFGMASTPEVSDPGLGQQARQGIGGGMGKGIRRGMGMGRGMGRGMGMGKGMGRGMGKGMERGMDTGEGMDRDTGNVNGSQQTERTSASAMGKEQELEKLKSEAEFMVQRLSEIQQHIEDIENQR